MAITARMLMLAVVVCALMLPGMAPAASVNDGFDPNDNGAVRSIVVQADGKILAGGSFMTIGGQSRNRLARLNTDGSVDVTFTTGFASAEGSVKSIAVQADGKIVVGGDFTTIGGQPRNRIARLNANGSLDTTFNPNANNVVHSLALQPDGKKVVGGDFTTMGGQPRNHIARLSADEAALQELTVSDDGTTITWMRSGSSPDLHGVTFEQAPDAATWTALGRATRIPGGWRLSGLTLPFNTTYSVRARGRASGGDHNASTGLVESVRQFWSPPFLRINDVSKAEGNAGSTPFAFTVYLMGGNPGTVSVNYATFNETATAGIDYTAASGTLTFAPGQTSKTVTVNVTRDAAVEPNETFFVSLSSPSGATIFDGQGQGAIVNDD